MRDVIIPKKIAIIGSSSISFRYGIVGKELTRKAKYTHTLQLGPKLTYISVEESEEDI
jgi:hypothetical protein